MIYEPLNVAIHGTYASPTTCDNATLMAVSNATAFQRYIHYLPETWPGLADKDQGVNPVTGGIGNVRYTLGNSPVHSPSGSVFNVLTRPSQDYRSASIAIQANSVIKIKKASGEHVFATTGARGNPSTSVGASTGVLFTKIGYTD